MQTILGVVYGVLFIILLGAGAFFIVIGWRIVSALNDFAAKVLTAAANLERESAAVREALRNGKEESEKLRSALLPFSESMNRTSTSLLEVTKGFDRFDLMRAALESNSSVGKVVVEISDRMIKQLAATAEVGALICNTVLRGASVRGGDGQVPAEVTFNGPPASPHLQEDKEEATFHTYSEEEAALNEKMEKAKASGTPVDEKPERAVPLSSMNKAGDT